MNLTINASLGSWPGELPVEIVERKGLGHPDTICDALAEQLSIALSQYYQEHFGLILHHNVDKVLLSAGSSTPTFGGGEVTKPIEIYLAGRATESFKGAIVPIRELALDGTAKWFRDRFHALDPDLHVKVHCLNRPGSRDLVELYLRQQAQGIWLANDTSCGVGFAPLSDMETVVYQVERFLNSSYKAAHPETGEDIKVMGVRQGRHIHLTVACAFVSRHVVNVDDYIQKKQALAQAVLETARSHTRLDVSVEVNTGDDPSSGSVYLTVTGTSAEAGDDGEAGRGNRINGLITPFRPMTIESAAGKNPVTHVGKLYNIAASLIASSIVEEAPEVGAVSCYLVSQIGQPINEPQSAYLELYLREPRALGRVRPRISQNVGDHLARIHTLSNDILQGRLAIDRWPLKIG